MWVNNFACGAEIPVLGRFIERRRNHSFICLSSFVVTGALAVDEGDGLKVFNRSAKLLKLLFLFQKESQVLAVVQLAQLYFGT